MAFGGTARLETQACPFRRVGQLTTERLWVDELAPFIREQENGLRQVQRRKFGIDGRGDDHIGKRHVRILKPGPLFPEKDAAFEPRLMRLTVIGCSDAFSSGGRYHSCYLLDTAQGRLMLDCGANSPLALKRADIEVASIDAIVISHCHAKGGILFSLGSACIHSATIEAGSYEKAPC